MSSHTSNRTKKPPADEKPRKVVNRLVENDLIKTVSYKEYRDKVQASLAK